MLSGKAASWNSSDPSVATVGVTNGVVSAIAPGTSTITATIEGVTGSGTVTVISAQAYEPNDTPATATPIAPGETQTHSMPVGDVDWLSLSITQTSSVRLILKGASTKSHVHDFNLYDATGTKLLATMSGIPSNGITLQFSAAPAGAKVKICADASDNVCNGGPGDLDIGSYDVTFTVLSASSSPDPRPTTTLDPPSATARTRRPPSWW